MIDWVKAHNPAAVFAVSGSDEMTYGELIVAAAKESRESFAVLTPLLDVESISSILGAFSSGGAVLLGPGQSAPDVSTPGGAAVVVATSGSSGNPKWVRLSAGNWLAAVEASARHLNHDREDQWLLAMPLHHVGGLSILLRTAYVGGSVRVLSRFEPAAFSAALRGGATIASVVPTMLERILDHDDKPFSGLKAVLVGGGPIPPGLLERAAARGLPVLPSYGMTETCGQVATLLPGSPLAHHAHLLPGVEAQLAADGRLQLRGAMVSPGYLGEPDRDSSEWFTTGDIASIGDDETLRILGRADEVIVSGGENVSPEAVEAVLGQHPGVMAALVLGLESEEWGSEVACLYEGTARADDLRAWAKERLPGFMVPKRWKGVPDLPMTPLGKPDRGAARLIFEGSDR